MKIVLFLSDNQFVEGILLDVKKDYLVVNVNQNVFYIALEHIQGLSKNSKGFRVPLKKIPYLNLDTLADVLMALQYNLVSINSLGKQAIFGMLSKISEDHIILIDNMEQLYIQKSYISNIYKGKYEIYERDAHIHKEPAIEESSSHLNVEPKEQLDPSLDEEIENCQHNEEVIVKQIKITNKSESEKYVEEPINAKLTEVETDSVNVINEHLVTHPMNEIIKETSLLQLDTQDLVDKTEDNERHEEPSQEGIIRDIAPRMNDESKEQLDSSLEEEIEHHQHNEEVIAKLIQTTNKNESEKYVEEPINAKLTEVETDSVNVTNEHLVTHPMNEIIKETNLLQLDTQDSVDKTEANERREEPGQERILRDIAPRMNDESKEQLDYSTEEEIQVNQHEEQVMIKRIQSKNIKEAKKYVETPIMKKHYRREMEDANVSNENLEDHPKTEVKEKFNLSHLYKQNLLNMDEKLSLEVDHQDILKSEKNIISEEQYMIANPRFRRKKKRKLKSICCTIKNNKHVICQKKLEASEFPVHEEDSNKVAHRSKRFKSLIHPTGDNTSNNKLKSNENFDVLDENPKPTETCTSPLSLRQINPKEEKAILEKQYYALMKHASRKYVEMQHSTESFMSLEIFFLPVRKISINEEATVKGQYYSLMKHAEKMYCQLKDERLKNEI